MNKLILSVVLLCTFTSLSYCQEDDRSSMVDAENCKDHPMFNRMPNMIITDCSKNYNEAEALVGENETKTLEGMKSVIEYGCTQSEASAPSFLQIVKNYENAIKKYDGKRVFYSSNQGRASLFLRSEGKDFWVLLQDGSGARVGNFLLTVLEMEAMKQDISANAILDELNAKGSVALYINFETGKSEIKSESQKIVDQVAEMLRANAALKISIEGHTDNVGKAAANKALSDQRATSVMKALVTKGIDKGRLAAKGWGQEKPIQDNSTEGGRAKNRRVEIVKVS